MDMEEKESFFSICKGFCIEMGETTKGFITDYFNGVFDDVKEEICHSKFCTCISYISSVIGVIMTIIMLGLIMYHSIGMLFTFCMVGFGLVLGVGIIWLWTHFINQHTENRVIKIISYPIVLFIILCLVLLFKMILM